MKFELTQHEVEVIIEALEEKQSHLQCSEEYLGEPDELAELLNAELEIIINNLGG